MLVLYPIYLSKSTHFSLFSNFIFHFYLHCHHLIPNHPLSPMLSQSPHFPSQPLPTQFPHRRPSSRYFKTRNVTMSFHVDHLPVGPQDTENEIKLLQVGYKSLPIWPLASSGMACWTTPPLNRYAQPQRSSGFPEDRLIPASRPSPTLFPQSVPPSIPPAICTVSSFSDFTPPH